MLLLLALLLGGCSSFESNSYAPKLAEVRTLVGSDGDELSVRTIATIVGVRRADARAGIPRLIETRLRVENNSRLELEVDPSDITLVTRDLVTVPKPWVQPLGLQRYPPGSTGTITASFPLEKDQDLSGLILEWKLRIGASVKSQSATFERQYGTYGGSRSYGYDPYWHERRYGP